MIKSMTGFGNDTCLYEDTAITIDIKTINSKVFDLSQRVPSTFKDKEVEIKSIISRLLERGKIDVTITVDQSQDILDYTVDKEKVKIYFQELQDLANEMKIDYNDSDLLKAALKMPDIFTNSKNNVDKDLWLKLQESIIKACHAVDECRIEEGKTLEEDFILRIKLIEDYLNKVEPFENQRIDTVKNRLLKNLNELNQNFDENRFEQELILYLEKLDITEEKLRLKQHCQYFIETIKEKNANGKKLSFISQEIGREINTLGSKACDVDIQKLVVQMKDELEKIKEQLSNIL